MICRTMHKERGHMLDFMVDHGGLERKGQRKSSLIKVPSTLGAVDSVSGRFYVSNTVLYICFHFLMYSYCILGPRLPGQGCNQLTQEIVSAICLDDRCVCIIIYITGSLCPYQNKTNMVSQHYGD